jgi:hypothetical protein
MQLATLLALAIKKFGHEGYKGDTKNSEKVKIALCPLCLHRGRCDHQQKSRIV